MLCVVSEQGSSILTKHLPLVWKYFPYGRMELFGRMAEKSKVMLLSLTVVVSHLAEEY